MSCGHIPNIQAAMLGKKIVHYEKPPPVTLLSFIDFYAQNNDIFEDDKWMEPINKETRNHKPLPSCNYLWIFKNKGRVPFRM